MPELNIGNIVKKVITTDSPFGDVSCIAEQAHQGSTTTTIIDQNALKRYLENARLGKAMGVYFYQLCKLRDAMGKKHLSELLNQSRKERLDRIKETRDDRCKDIHRKGGGRVRGNGNG